MSLKEYLKKRDLLSSNEPKVKIKKINSSNFIFVIQEHHATHLHWDFRLEMDGVLKSWALPKIPQKIRGIKRLAVQVEDHPLGYANFEGEIIEGYGKGKVKIWDKGTYKLEDKNPSKIVFELNGKKLKGKYVLVKMNFKGDKKKNNWLLMKL